MMHGTRMLGLALWLGIGAASAQTLPLPPGSGFTWEHVGDAPRLGFFNLTFDAGGTLWNSDPVEWLDTSGGGPGVWVTPQGPLPRPRGPGILTLGPHPAAGPPRADTVIVSLGGPYHSVNGGRTWSFWTPDTGNFTLYEIPAGLPHAGRLLVGAEPAFSDDRGATWSERRYPPKRNFVIQQFLALPRPADLPGARSGRDPAAPAGWPAGRIVGVGDGGVGVYSDDGGDSYVSANLIALGRHAQFVTLVRRPDGHPMGPGPRLLATGYGEGAFSSVWASDDAGETWRRIAALTEPGDGPHWPSTEGIYALSELGETDAGAGGRALIVLGRGLLYQTTDAGETWAVVGRAPGIVSSSGSANTFVGTSELGPDGRLYVGVQGLGTLNWLWRTTEPFLVAEAPSPAVPSGLSLSVRPNPAGSSTSVVVTAPAPSEAVVTVVDATGREVARVHAGPLAAGATPLALDTSGWAVGVYVVRATVGDQTATARLVVAR